MTALITGRQIFQSILNNYQVGATRERADSTVSALLTREFLQDTLTLKTQTLHSINDGDILFTASDAYVLRDNTALSVGIAVSNGYQNGVFGQLDELD